MHSGEERGFYLLICTLILLTFIMEAWDSTTACWFPTKNFCKSCPVNKLCVTFCKETCEGNRGAGEDRKSEKDRGESEQEAISTELLGMDI